MLTKCGKLFSARACKISLAKIEWDRSEEKREEGQQVIMRPRVYPLSLRPQYSVLSPHQFLTTLVLVFSALPS